jgi:hypothetical protein
MHIRLGVVGRFIAAQVTPQEQPCDDDHHRGYENYEIPTALAACRGRILSFRRNS